MRESGEEEGMLRQVGGLCTDPEGKSPAAGVGCQRSMGVQGYREAVEQPLGLKREETLLEN